MPSPSFSPDSIREFERKLLDYCVFAKELPAGGDPEQEGRREQILAAIRAVRQPALMAGVRLAGESRANMDQLLMGCLSACIRHGQWVNEEEKGSPWAYSRLVAAIVPSEQRLDDLARLADAAQTPDRPGGAAPLPAVRPAVPIGAETETRQGEREKPKGRRGRKPDTDPKADKRVADAWRSGQYPTYADCGKALGKSAKEIKKALDRERHREGGKRPRARE
jgi:hypothetical protein